MISSRIVGSPVCNCFATFPVEWQQDQTIQNLLANHLPQQIFVKLNGSVFIGWSGLFQAKHKNAITVDPCFLDKLGLGGDVDCSLELVSITPNDSNLFSVWVEPLDCDSWEIIDLNASLVEDIMLQQIRIVYPNQCFPLWIHGSCVFLKIIKIECNSTEKKQQMSQLRYACLNADSEIIVSPLPRNIPVESSLEKLDIPKKFLLRAQPLEWTIQSGRMSDELGSSYVVGIPESVWRHNTNQWAFVQGLDYDRICSGSDKPIHGIYCKPVSVPTKFAKHCNDAIISPFIRSLIGADQPFSRIRINFEIPKQSPTKYLPQILLYAASLNVEEEFRDYIHSQFNSITNEIPIHDGMQVRLCSGAQVKVVFSKPLQDPIDKKKGLPDPPDYAIITLETLSSLKFKHVKMDGDVFKDAISTCKSLEHHAFERFKGFSEQLLECSDFYAKALVLKSASSSTGFGFTPVSGCLVSGSVGSGKTIFTGILSETLSRSLHLYTIKIDAGTLKNGGLKRLKVSLDEIKAKAIWNAPSFIVFDNLDVLVPTEPEQPQESNPEKDFAMLLKGFFQDLDYTKVLYLATCLDSKAIHPILQADCFDFRIQLSAPNKLQRIEILEGLYLNCAGELNPRHVNISNVSSKLEGYSISDLKCFFSRALTESKLRQIKSSDKSPLKDSDFYKALEGFTPVSLLNAKTQTVKESWEMIGGLSEIKETLLQTLKWPTIYKTIFETSPIRLRSGILLYGYPGTGKTMLASSVASQCGLNFISVKGPELLNKYIGSSEAALRQVFERAKSSRPCLLFFDEFDSIAPKRGQDSTGVTDRVVNQLLTELDGAEGLTGVYVIAASSRPNQIDPALLRPGRLDKKIFVRLPDSKDRREILSLLTNKLSLAADVDLDSLDTSSFTGADLRSLVSNAQLLACHDELHRSSKLSSGTFFDRDSVKILQGTPSDRQMANLLGHSEDIQVPSTSDDQSPSLILHQCHFSKAMAELRPSLSKEERRRFARAFEEFEQGIVEGAGTRSTLG